MNPSHNCKRCSPEPPPSSAVCSFQSGTVLDVVKGSHRRGLETDFREDVRYDHAIPTGWSSVFHSLLMHHGMGSESGHIRGHMYLAAKGCTLPSFGMIESTVQGPDG